MSETADTDALAAEYVLGTLDGPERAQAQGLLGTDQGFAAKVRVWERRLGELHLMVEPVEPDGEIWHRIKSKMPAKAPPPVVPPPAPAVEVTKAPAPAPIASAPAPAAAAAEAAPATPSVVPEPTPSTESVPAPAVASVSTPSAEPALTLPPAPVLPPLVPSAPAPSAPAQIDTPAPRAPVAEPGDGSLLIRRRLRRWRAFATLLILILLAMGALVAAWKYAPERVPPRLQAAELLRLVGITVAGPSGPTRQPAPPESQFDE